MLDDTNLMRFLEKSAELGWRKGCEGHAFWCIQQARLAINEGRTAHALGFLDAAEKELQRSAAYPGLSPEERASIGRAA